MTKVEYILEMIEDGMKDARKECMWADELTHQGDKDGAEMFRAEGQKRLQGVKDVLEKHGAMLDEPAAAVPIAKAWKKRIENEIAERMQKLK